MNGRIDRILVLTPSYLPTVGGLERVVELLAKCWARQGIGVRIFRAGEEVDLDGKVKDGGGPFRIARAANWADVVLGVNTPLRQLPLVLGAWRKVVLQHHSMYSFAHPQPWRQRSIDVIRRVVIKSRPNVAVSDQVAEVLPSACVRVIGNPVELFEFDNVPWRERSFQFLFVGRFTRDKGLDVFLDALSQIDGRWRSAVVGYGPEGRLMQSPQIAEMIRVGVLDDLGPLPPRDVAQLMANSRWVVIPSRSETFGQVAIEGLSQGCGLIVSEVGGLARYAGRCALGFAGPDFTELARAMKQASSLRSLPERWSEPSGRFVEEHLVDSSAERYVRFFVEVARATRTLPESVS